MRKAQIILINRFFHPDISATSQILSDLAFELAANGSSVQVVTSRLLYNEYATSLLPKDSIRAVQVHRVWTSRFGRGSILGRLCDYLTFYIAAPLKVLQIARTGDIIVAKTDPPMISAAVGVVSSLRGAKLINWLQDVFPEVATTLGMKLGGSLAKVILGRVRDLSWRSARANVVLGHRMKEVVHSHAPHCEVFVVPNWSPNSSVVPLRREDNPLDQAWGFKGKFVVGYSGNLGRAHELGIVLDAAAHLRSRTDISFLIIGDGNQKKDLQARAAQANLTNVIFKPYQPTERLRHSLTLPNVHLVSLKPALEGLIVPSKFYSSIAAGRAIVFIGASDGEIAVQIAKADCGVTIRPDDLDGLAQAIQALADNTEYCDRLGRNARCLFEAEYTRDIAIQKWSEVLRFAASE